MKARFDHITVHINKEQQIINYFLNNYKNTISKTVKKYVQNRKL